MFYGLPIHIMRDLFITARSFTKRLLAFLKYRRATQDMNARYEDASVEDIQREDTCIICREEMRPWSVTNPPLPPAAPGAVPPRTSASINERNRPKKLPCGHILHLGCLKSWLERQQACPTCRRSVVDNTPAPAGHGAANNVNPAGHGPQPPVPGQQDGAGAGAGPQPPGAGRNPVRGMRMLNFGPLRVGFGQANIQDVAQDLGAPQPGQDNVAAGNARIYGLEFGFPRRRQPEQQQQPAGSTNTTSTNTVQEQLQQLEQQILGEIRGLQATQQELQLVQLLQAELARLRLIQNGGADPLAANFQMPQLGPFGSRNVMPFNVAPPQMQRHGARPGSYAIPAGSSDLPPGVTIPEGWSLLPLQRLDGPSAFPLQLGVPQTSGVGAGVSLPVPAANVSSVNTGGSAPTATTTNIPQAGISPMTNPPHPPNSTSVSNNNLSRTPSAATHTTTLLNPEIYSMQAVLIRRI